MKQWCAAAAVLGVALVAAPALGYAQPVDIGKREYDNNCAVCHGSSGKGDGPLGQWLNKAPTDLTKIQKENAGVFPFDRIYRIVDGREAVGLHGPREMPVWGRNYSTDAAGYFAEFGTGKDLESFVRGRIVAMVGYIYSLQEK